MLDFATPKIALKKFRFKILAKENRMQKTFVGTGPWHFKIS